MTVSFMDPPAAPDIRATLVPNEFQDFDDIDELLAGEVARYFDDPYGWVMWAFDWGHGDLEGFEGPDTWQKEALIEWGQGIKDKGFNGVDPVDPYRYSVASGHGIGKGHPIDMPFGDGYWGDLVTGSKVFNAKGELTEVLGVNHYKREHFKVTFDDGSSTVVSGEHEWHVRGRQERRKNLDGWITLETQEILAKGVKRPNGKSLARQWEIPVQAPVKYGDCTVPVDAYTYGVWLGDGDKRSGRITNIDPEVWENVTYEYSSAIEGITKTLYGLSVDLRDNGLFGCTTYTATVDRRYIQSAQRLSVLQGLLDTDGWVEQCGSAAFCSASKQLTLDVVEIARSLGLKAREPKFKRNDCAGAWQTHITWDGATELFRIKRKQEALVHAEHRYQCRWIDSIESVGLMDGMCIEVEGGLYQTNDFIVTHNSAMSSWIILFIMSTRPYAKGIVTANTGEQLRTKTWSELGKWRERCIVGHWFEYNNGKGSMSLYHKSFASSWRVDAQTCREENSEAFAGLHAANSTPFYLFDEASAVPSKIWEVAEGGLTDGEPMFFCFGNPTRNDGKFHATFDPGSRWINKQIDSRQAKMTNKRLIAQWEEDHGEDSDFFRVRVKGQFPKAGDMQFMPSDIVEMSQTYPLPAYLGDEPLIMSLDVARGGGDDCRIAFRRGKDLKSETSYRIPYEQSRDSMRMLGKVTMVIERHQPNAIMVDSTGVGGPIHDRLKELGYNSYEVHFGSKADDEKRYYNKTAEMGDRLRRAMMDGARIPNDEQLKRELTCREFWHDDKDKLVLERKKDIKQRLGYSPDWADAMYLLYAMENVPRLHYKRGDADVAPWARENMSRDKDYDPLADM